MCSFNHSPDDTTCRDACVCAHVLDGYRALCCSACLIELLN